MLLFIWNKPKETKIDKISDFTIITLKINGMRFFLRVRNDKRRQNRHRFALPKNLRARRMETTTAKTHKMQHRQSPATAERLQFAQMEQFSRQTS